MKKHIQAFLARWIVGPALIITSVSLGYEWMFHGVYWVVFGFIPVTPLLIISCLVCGLHITKLGYIDGDVSSILKFIGEKPE